MHEVRTKNRPSGLKYKLKVKNRAWFKPGNKVWNKGTKGLIKPNAGSFKKRNGYWINVQGYKVIYDRKREYDGILEHRLVMENIIGRELLPNEVVHHIDRNRLNNHPENLVLMTRGEHTKLHAREA